MIVADGWKKGSRERMTGLQIAEMLIHIVSYIFAQF
jgi:hypothetical protein